LNHSSKENGIRKTNIHQEQAITGYIGDPCFGAIAIIVSALFVFLNQILDVSWQILTIAATVVILLILGGDVETRLLPISLVTATEVEIQLLRLLPLLEFSNLRALPESGNSERAFS